MPFSCPECFAAGSLEIVLTIQLPADNRSDDIALQVVRCSQCSFRGLAVYEESRRGSLETEKWDHTGYRVNESDLTSIVAVIQACSDPYNGNCQCESHRKLGWTDLRGQWQGLTVKPEGVFPMRLNL